MACYNKNVLLIFFTSIILMEQCVAYPHFRSKQLLHLSQDSLHPFQEPGENDIRGPCPGLNAAANHGYISRDGVTTFVELIKMQQELYNAGLDLAIVLATLGVALGGDIITGKLSIGGKSFAVPGLLQTPEGLNAHGKFEGDTSLTRNDYYLAHGNNFAFNGTLYGMMFAEAQKHAGLYTWKAMADYRYLRYQQSLAENGQFLFTPLSLLLYGASSFLYELFPSGTDNFPNEAVIFSFFGAKPLGNHTWQTVPERIPDYWVKRTTPYTLVDVVIQIVRQYLEHIVLFGGNTGRPNSFVLDLRQLTFDRDNINGNLCLIYQIILSVIPLEVESIITVPVSLLNFVLKNLDPIFGLQFGCPSASILPKLRTGSAAIKKRSATNNPLP